MLGATEYVAEACEETLKELGHEAKIHLKPNFSTLIQQTFTTNNSNISTWIICTSTHGAGDFPDNIQQFISDLKNCEQDLSSINYLIIGVGDSSYDTFCKAANDINNLLQSNNCKELIPIKLLDMSKDIDPEELSQQWLIVNKDLL